MKKVAIGGGQGFWGDSPDAAIHMIRNADIQYMGCDYLAELTLSIMAKQQLKDPTKGFAPDFTTRILKEAGKEAWDKHIKICTNAGGMNINGCVDGIRQWAEGNSMSGYNYFKSLSLSMNYYLFLMAGSSPAWKRQRLRS